MTLSSDVEERELEELVQALDSYIPPFYLIKCEWYEPYPANGDLVEFERVSRENADRFRMCYIRHNRLIDYLHKYNNKDK